MIPTIVTLLGVVLAGAAAYLFSVGSFALGALIYALSGICDVGDGFLARFNTPWCRKTRVGRYADPAADLIRKFAGFIAIMPVISDDLAILVTVYLVIEGLLVLFMGIYAVIMLLRGERLTVFEHGEPGKARSLLATIAVICYAIGAALPPFTPETYTLTVFGTLLLGAAIVALIATVGDYVNRMYRHIRQQQRIRQRQ